MIKLNSIADIHTGYNPRSTVEVQRQTVFTVSAKDLATNFTEVDKLTIPISYNNYLQDGDILVKSRGTSHEAKVFKASHQERPYIAASTLLVVRLIVDTYKSAYITCIINSKKTQQLLRSSSAGSIVPVLSPSSLGAIPCPEISLDEQVRLEKITGLLDDYCTSLVKYQRAGENLIKAIEQQLMKGVL